MKFPVIIPMVLFVGCAGLSTDKKSEKLGDDSKKIRSISTAVKSGKATAEDLSWLTESKSPVAKTILNSHKEIQSCMAEVDRCELVTSKPELLSCRSVLDPCAQTFTLLHTSFGREQAERIKAINGKCYFWSYQRKTKNWQTDSGTKNLTGKFGSKMLCNEAKIADKETVKDSEGCYRTDFCVSPSVTTWEP